MRVLEVNAPNGHLQLVVSPRDSHQNLPAIGGVHKLQIFVEEKTKEFPRKIRNFNNRGGLITPGRGYKHLYSTRSLTYSLMKGHAGCEVPQMLAQGYDVMKEQGTSKSSGGSGITRTKIPRQCDWAGFISGGSSRLETGAL